MLFSFFQPQSIFEQGKRDNQEDSIFPSLGRASNKDRLFILCDGMGGYEKGEVASSTICKSLSECLLTKNVFSEDIFFEALTHSYKVLLEKVKGDGNRMGTTLTFLFFHNHGCFAAHVGDSRIYHLRPRTHEILYVSRDHSLVNDLLDAGMLSKEDVDTFPQRHVITKAIRADKEISRSDVEIKHITDIQDGDYFLLLSDGMLENLSDEELLNLICLKNISDEEKKELLIKNSKYNSDNHSAYIIHINNVRVDEEDDKCVDLSASHTKGRFTKVVDCWKIAFFVLCIIFAIIVLCFFN